MDANQTYCGDNFVMYYTYKIVTLYIKTNNDVLCKLYLNFLNEGKIFPKQRFKVSVHFYILIELGHYKLKISKIN